MAMPRPATTPPLIALTDRIRVAPGLQLRDSRETADGLEAVLVDKVTGQVALLTLSPVNQGFCPGCGHLSHNEIERCEAIATITKEACRCSVWRFPRPDVRPSLDDLSGMRADGARGSDGSIFE